MDEKLRLLPQSQVSQWIENPARTGRNKTTFYLLREYHGTDKNVGDLLACCGPPANQEPGSMV
jgi:hypothetical protein